MSELQFNEGFNKIEQDILNNVMSTSKAILETFKFKIIYSLGVTKKDEDKCLKFLKEFRKKNRDPNLSRNEAYKKYLNLY